MQSRTIRIFCCITITSIYQVLSSSSPAIVLDTLFLCHGDRWLICRHLLMQFVHWLLIRYRPRPLIGNLHGLFQFQLNTTIKSMQWQNWLFMFDCQLSWVSCQGKIINLFLLTCKEKNSRLFFHWLEWAQHTISVKISANVTVTCIIHRESKW